MRLGRQPRPAGTKFVRLRDHLIDELPKAPASWNGWNNAIIHLGGNDRFGSCTFAGLANLASIQTAAAGGVVAFKEQAIIDAYFTHTGGADVGAVEVAVLNRVLKGGFPAEQFYRIRTWAAVDHDDVEQLKATASMFSGLYLGVALPDDWEDGFQSRSWEVTGPGSWKNGHCVVVGGYDQFGVQLATWGEVWTAPWEWMLAYCEEAYVLLDETRAQMSVLDAKNLIAAAEALAADNGAGG